MFHFTSIMTAFSSGDSLPVATAGLGVGGSQPWNSSVAAISPDSQWSERLENVYEDSSVLELQSEEIATHAKVDFSYLA